MDTSDAKGLWKPDASAEPEFENSEIDFELSFVRARRRDCEDAIEIEAREAFARLQAPDPEFNRSGALRAIRDAQLVFARADVRLRGICQGAVGTWHEIRRKREVIKDAISIGLRCEPFFNEIFVVASHPARERIAGKNTEPVAAKQGTVRIGVHALRPPVVLIPREQGTMAGIAKIDGLNRAREQDIDIRFNNVDDIGVGEVAHL